MIFIYIVYLIVQQSQATNVIEDLKTDNWTSCEEFLMNTTFDIQSVIDVDWKIFYFWNYEVERSYNIRFSLATPILVDRFKVALRDMDTSVNWTRAVLFMETSIDFSALYLTTNISGQFRIIPSFAFQMEKIPLLIFGLKIVKPGYLGIINCLHRFCYALAPVDKMPEENKINLAAEMLGFKGDFNRSYLTNEYDPPIIPSPYSEDDEDEDEQLEIENEEYALKN
ncbi:unnamed protein product [Euphydryas editha]|uniref:Uncharacterized protein n=1 Tax=Euphydryas editha TaxID=104508 RepID=A0AAU9U6T4_EUPED|nr:unnamed protein product [Euphydryas editha]